MNRRTSVRTAASAVLVAAALSLTACSGGDTGAKADGVTSHAVSGAEKPAAKGGDKGAESGGSATVENTAKEQGPAGEDAAESAKTAVRTASAKSAAKPVTCTVGNSQIRTTKVTRPINHLLMTLTNMGDKPCYAYGAPYLGFTGDQSTVPWIDESQPQAVVTVEPGKSAYASVSLSGDGDNGRKVKTMTYSMAGKEMAGSVGGTATNEVPGGSVYVDDSYQVSYWQQTMSDALVW
ncbi:DUF4232 domain-containing protein [Streptomyces tsukubensis]|nr:DUF4232 domain-containing protein [Streptomyces tsukubensis]